MNILLFIGSRYVELYFDSPRQSASSSNHRRSKSNDSPQPPSRSPSKPKNNDDSRSRSIVSFDNIIYVFLFIQYSR